MEFVQGDISGGGSDQQRGSQAQRFLHPESKPPGNIKTNRSHRRQRGILDDDKSYRMTKDCKKRGDQEYDRLDVISHQWNVFDRDRKATVKELPKALDIESEIKGPVFIVRPADI